MNLSQFLFLHIGGKKDKNKISCPADVRGKKHKKGKTNRFSREIAIFRGKRKGQRKSILHVEGKNTKKAEMATFFSCRT